AGDPGQPVSRPGQESRRCACALGRGYPRRAVRAEEACCDTTHPCLEGTPHHREKEARHDQIRTRLAELEWRLIKPSLPDRLSPSVPQLKSHFGRRLARWFIGICGWKLVGEFPDVARLVLIAAPHSSWLDGFWGLLIKIAIGIDISFMGKRELFVGPLGWIVRQLGGIPVERGSPHGLVQQMAARFQRGYPPRLRIAAAGTRKAVKKWRTGFWHIARAADVPILPIYFHYPERTIGVGPLFVTSGDLDVDLQRLRYFYKPWQGRNRGVD